MIARWRMRHWSVAFGTLIVAYFVLWFWPTHRHVENLRRHLANEQSYLKQAAALPAEVARMQEQLDDVNAFCRQWEQLAVRDEQLGNFLPRLTTSAARHDVELLAVVPQAARRSELFDQYPLEIRCQGKFHSLGGFLADLDQFPEPLLIQTLELKPSEKNKPILTCTLNVTIFGYSAGNND